MFPKVTYDKRKYEEFNFQTEEIEFYKELDANYAMASELGIIWLSKPSIKWLLHELLHIIGWKLFMPPIWHRLIHKIL